MLLAEGHINLLIFKFLTEGKPNLEILQIVRHYVSTPKNSAFADELSKLMRHYISYNLSNPRKKYEESFSYDHL